MSISKIGTPVKIKAIATSEVDFDAMKQKIASEQKWFVCECGHRLGNIGPDGTLDIQHRGMQAIVTVGSKVRCPSCKKVSLLQQ